MTWPGWTREPLVHFLVAGSLLFAFFAWSGGNAPDPSSRVIEVGRGEQAQLALQFERTMGRAPTDAELDAQIDQFVRDEVLYREALRLGLDQGDAVVRRRLVTKMDMTAGAAAEAAQPSDQDLQAFFEENAARYGSGPEFSIDQLVFDRKAQAQTVLMSLDNSHGWRSRGNASMLPRSLEFSDERAIASYFGERFARAVAALEADGQWRGPIQSGFGWHLVRLRERRQDQPEFEDVRGKVETDWRSARIAERKQRAYQILRGAYRVEIDR